MGLGKAFRKQPEQRHHRVAGLGGFQVIVDGRPVITPATTYYGGMSIPGAWRAAVLLSDLLGRSPWDAYRTGADDVLVKIRPTPPVLDQPCPPDTRIVTITQMALDLIWHGNGIAVVASRNSSTGTPTSYLPVSATQVSVRRANMTDFAPISYGNYVYDIGGRQFGSHDILHIKGSCAPGSLRGMGVLEHHLATLQLARQQKEQAADIAHHGVPTGVINVTDPDVTGDELKDIKANWLESQRARTVAVLNTAMEFQPISWNPDEMELVAARKYTDIEIANIFGVPASFINAETSSRVYSNIEQDALNLLKFSLGGHLERFEEVYSLMFPRGTSVKANLDFLLRADTLARYQAHQIGITAGFLTPDEARKLEDRPALTAAQKAEMAMLTPERPGSVIRPANTLPAQPVAAKAQRLDTPRPSGHVAGSLPSGQ